MAEIYEISGTDRRRRSARIGAAPQSSSERGILEEMNQRAKLVTKRRPIDTAILSEGEMAVALMAQRYEMLAQYYPDVPGYAKAADMALNALHNGLHTGRGVGAWTKVLDPEQKEVAWTIINARNETAPASGWLGWEDKARTPADGVGSIPLLDCDALFPQLNPADYPGQGWVYQENANRAAKLIACTVENKWRQALNADWEGNGAVLIYEHLKASMVPNNLSGQAVLTLGSKSANHKYFVDAVTGASKISRSNLDIWLVNGCIAKSISGANGQSLGPQTPLDYIETFRKQGQEGIGAFPVIVIPIALAVMALNYKAVKHLVGVLTGEEALKQAIKAQVGDIQAFIQRFGSEIANLASSDDWKTPPSANDTGTPSNDDGSGNDGNGGNGKGGFDLGKNAPLIGGGLLLLALAMGGDDKK